MERYSCEQVARQRRDNRRQRTSSSGAGHRGLPVCPRPAVFEHQFNSSNSVGRERRGCAAKGGVGKNGRGNGRNSRSEVSEIPLTPSLFTLCVFNSRQSQKWDPNRRNNATCTHAAVTAAGSHQLSSPPHSCYLETSAKPPFPHPQSRMVEKSEEILLCEKQQKVAEPPGFADKG